MHKHTEHNSKHTHIHLNTHKSRNIHDAPTFSSVLAGACSKFSCVVSVFDQWRCWWRLLKVFNKRCGEKTDSMSHKSLLLYWESRLEEVNSEVWSNEDKVESSQQKHKQMWFGTAADTKHDTFSITSTHRNQKPMGDRSRCFHWINNLIENMLINGFFITLKCTIAISYNLEVQHSFTSEKT